ncbi:peptidylprolyl isomerase [Geomicrobium sp. JSM 1781026]|uniref:peptidylprolyl isomerase n=1 Tax=Geomicrobium sp. JSM 1781026 TaxID=3344580 RepID=UPI0035C25E93
MNKKHIILALSLTLVLAACNDDETDENDSAASVDEGNEVATVNDVSITEGEFVDYMKNEYGEMAFNQMIQSYVFDQAADELGIGEEEIQSEMDDVKEQFGVESDEELLQMLQMQQVPVSTVDQLVDDFIVPQVVIDELRYQDVDISEEDMQAYYEENEDQLIEVEARHILVEDEETAQEVQQELEDGMSFEDAVEEYSQDTNSIPAGGNVGFFPREGVMEENFSETAFDLDVGEVSDPVESSADYGYHIIEVLDRNDSFEDVQEEIEMRLMEEQARPSNEVIQELMEEADINITESEYEDWFQLPEPME